MRTSPTFTGLLAFAIIGAVCAEIFFISLAAGGQLAWSWKALAFATAIGAVIGLVGGLIRQRARRRRQG